MKNCRALVVAAALAASCSTPARLPRAADPDRPKLKVMTYNVNYGLAGDAGIIGVIRDVDSDVVFLQETNELWETSLRAELSTTYPHMEFRHSPGAGGMAVLSKHTISESAVVAPPRGGWFPGWRVVIDTPMARIQALNVHLRPKVSDSGSYLSGYFTTDHHRLDQIRRYYGELKSDLPTLVVGDFNEGSDEDALQFLASRGFSNAKHDFEPGTPTWRWKTSVGSISSELDHIVHDDSLVPVDAWVVKQGRSDHFPVVAVFQLFSKR